MAITLTLTLTSRVFIRNHHRRLISPFRNRLSHLWLFMLRRDGLRYSLTKTRHPRSRNLDSWRSCEETDSHRKRTTTRMNWVTSFPIMFTRIHQERNHRQVHLLPPLRGLFSNCALVCNHVYCCDSCIHECNHMID